LSIALPKIRAASFTARVCISSFWLPDEDGNST